MRVEPRLAVHFARRGTRVRRSPELAGPRSAAPSLTESFDNIRSGCVQDLVALYGPVRQEVAPHRDEHPAPKQTLVVVRSRPATTATPEDEMADVQRLQ